MGTATDIEAALQTASPPAFHEAATHLARTLAAVMDQTVTPEVARTQIMSDPQALHLLEVLGGQQVHAGGSLLSFGNNNQIDRLEIRDLAGGNIVKINLAVDDRQGVFVDGGAVVYGPVIGDNAGTVNYFNVVMSAAHGTKLESLTLPPRFERTPRPAPPRALRTFYDREQELALLQTELAPGRGAWLYGDHGCGLTAILRQLAHAAGTESLSDGVLYIDGALETGEFDDLLQRVFGRFYHSDTPVSVTPDHIRSYLAAVQAVAAFDGLPLDRSNLTALADTLVHSAVFITADGPGTDTLRSVRLGGLPRQDAMRLVMMTYRPQQAIPAGPMHEDSQLGKLCAVLDDSPLALTLAAKLASEAQFTFKHLATVIDSSQAGTRPLERMLRCVLNHCSAAEQTLLAVLARVGALPLSTLLGLSKVSPQDIEGLLAHLSNLGLISGGTDRYSISNRSLARTLDHLLPAGDERKRAAAFFAGAAMLHRGDSRWLLDQHRHLLNAATTALAEGQSRIAATLVQTIHPTLVREGLWGSWRQCAVIAEQAAEQSGDQRLHAWALHEHGTRLGLTGDRVAAQALLTQALKVRRSLGDHAAAAVTLQNMRLLRLVPPPLPWWSSRTGIAVLATALSIATLLLLFWWGNGDTGDGPLIPSPSSNAVVVVVDTPTPTASITPISSAIPTPSATRTSPPTDTATATPLPPPTDTATAPPPPTETPTESPSPTLTATPTEIPSPTPTPTIPTPTPTAVPGPDLIVSGFQVITTIPGEDVAEGTELFAQTDEPTVPVLVTVRNQGSKEAAVFKVALEYYQEDAYPGGTPFVVSFVIPGEGDSFYPYSPTPIPPGGEVSFQGFARFSSSLAGTTVLLYAVADSCSGDEFMPMYCRVDEYDETNNRSSLVQVDLSP